MIWRFRLRRYEDAKGISGVGCVAEGCLFSTGKAVLAWNAAPHRSVGVYDSMEALIALHCHGDCGKIEWIDQHAAYPRGRKPL